MDLSTMRTNLRRDLKDETPVTEVPVTLDDCDSAWTAANYVNASLDYADRQQGSASALIQIGDTHSSGLAAFHDRAAIDLTGCHSLRFWIKSSIDLSAGDYRIVIDDTPGCSSPWSGGKSLDIPACFANNWYEHQVLLGDTSELSAVVSAGLWVNTDKGAATIHLDDIRAIKNTYKWTDDELDRHTARALKELSYHVPCEMNAELATTPGSREVSIATLNDRVRVFAVEYPAGQFPPRYQRFSLWQDTITLLGDEVPDGSDCRVYYGALHTLDEESCTVPAYLEDLLSMGVQGYALQAYAAYAVDRLQADYRYAGERAAEDAQRLLAEFRGELRRVGRFGKVRTGQLYVAEM